MAEARLTRRARRDLEALPGTVREAVLETLASIAIDPERTGKKLVGRLEGLWSARVGNYRVLYTIEGGTVIVRAIRHPSRRVPRAVAAGGRKVAGRDPAAPTTQASIRENGSRPGPSGQFE